MEKLESKMLSFLSEKLNKTPSSNYIKSQLYQEEILVFATWPDGDETHFPRTGQFLQSVPQ